MATWVAKKIQKQLVDDHVVGGIPTLDILNVGITVHVEYCMCFTNISLPYQTTLHLLLFRECVGKTQYSNESITSEENETTEPAVEMTTTEEIPEVPLCNVTFTTLCSSVTTKRTPSASSGLPRTSGTRP